MIDPHDAPEGYVAVENKATCTRNQCDGCAFDAPKGECGLPQDSRKACSPCERKDKTDVIFKKIDTAKSAPASHKPFFYALADNEGRPVMDEGCVNTDAEELTSQHQSAIDDLLVKVVPVYTGPQIEAMREAKSEAAKDAPAEPRSCCKISVDNASPTLACVWRYRMP